MKSVKIIDVPFVQSLRQSLAVKDKSRILFRLV